MREFTTFEAILKPLSKGLVEESAKRFETDYYSKVFKTRHHLWVMLYAQFYGLRSLRDLEIAFNSQSRLKGLVKCSRIRRSTLSDANAHRTSHCFLWIAEQLMTQLPRKKRKEVNKVVRKLDSSPIQLKGRGYDEWTLDQRTLRCQGLKLHVEYDGEWDMPTRAMLSGANMDDCRMGQSWPILEDTIYVFDKGYYDFNWWWKIEKKKAYFVTRLKNNVAIIPVEERVIADENIIEDQLFLFKNKNPRGGKKNGYVKPLRRVVVRREGKEKPLVLVSNLMDTPAEIISQLYKERWEIELFFKWIKQNLRVKKFLGKSKNAVETQLAIALIVYLLIGIFKLASKSKLSLHQLLVWVQYNFSRKKTIYRTFKPPEYDLSTPPLTLTISGGYL
jgi:Transposase DDE domain/Domain of unknown function (DUF4372)